MSEPPTEYQIGDIVNGYIWTGLEWARYYQVGDIANDHMWNGQEWVPVDDAPPTEAPEAEPSVEVIAESPTSLPTAGSSDFFTNPDDSLLSVTPDLGADSAPLYKRWWFWAVTGAVIALAAGAFALSQHQSDDPIPNPTSTTPTVSPTGSDQPSPTGSVNPSPTDTSSTSPVPSPSGTGISQITTRYGTFAPVTKAGVGSSVVDLPAGSDYGMVTAVSNADGVFAITELAADNTPTGDLLVDTSGPYSGTTAYGLVTVGAKATKLKIDASGPWHITIAPLDKAPVLTLPAKGASNAVYVYLGPATNWKIVHTAKASSNFSVVQYAQMPNLLVNAIGNYTGTVPVTAGPTIVTLDASGPWTITAAP
jgi:hypothetical protein